METPCRNISDKRKESLATLHYVFFCLILSPVCLKFVHSSLLFQAGRRKLGIYIVSFLAFKNKDKLQFRAGKPISTKTLSLISQRKKETVRQRDTEKSCQQKLRPKTSKALVIIRARCVFAYFILLFACVLKNRSAQLAWLSG